MRKVTNSRGLTLVELLVSMSIGFATTAAVLGIAHKFFNIRNLAQTYSGRQVETTLVLEDLETALRNSVKISPPEDLRTTNDAKYTGVAKIPKGSELSECQNDETSEVLRLTTLRRFHKVERLYRTWRENDSAGVMGPTHEMRVSIEGSAFTAVDPNDQPHEIFVVDADVLAMRRYKVLGLEVRKNVNLDPVDDLPKLNPDGSSQMFNYVALRLGLPEGLGGLTTSKKMATFISQSMVYTSDTYNYCLGKEERALLRLREQKEQRMNLLGADKGQFQIQTFKLSFGQVQRKKAVENSDFIPLIENLPNPECMNAVRFRILMSPGEKAQQAIKEAGSGSLADEVERQGSFFLQNFNLRRPANCP